MVVFSWDRYILYEMKKIYKCSIAGNDLSIVYKHNTPGVAKRRTSKTKGKVHHYAKIHNCYKLKIWYKKICRFVRACVCVFTRNTVCMRASRGGGGRQGSHPPQNYKT